ncbi:MAG: flagellar motor switch protein FliN [Buchnera aphidicola (Nurudea yanoniella)]
MNDKNNTLENYENNNTNVEKKIQVKKNFENNDDNSNLDPSVQKSKNLNFVIDIPIDITIELGKIELKIKDLLDLNTGSVLTLDKYSGEPLNILVNKCIIAKGELVIVDEKYGIRIVSIVDGSKYLDIFK